MAQATRWCFTINNYTPDDLELVKNFGTYGKCQEEVGENGTPHLQGCCVFKSNQRISALKKLHPTAHWEVMRGTLEQAEEYCSKEDTRKEGCEPFSWGERPTNCQGKRNDLLHAVEAMRSVVGGVRSRIDAAIDAEPTVVAKYARGLEVIAESLTRRSVSIGNFPHATLRTWQAELMQKLGEDPDDRAIYWYEDTMGNQGKSTFVKYYIDIHDNHAQKFMGPYRDMAYMLDVTTRVAFFDVTRTQAENMDHLYSFAEDLKNGTVISTKYGVVTKQMRSPHVVFFSNSPPPPAGTKWSADRVIHVRLGDVPAPLTF